VYFLRHETRRVEQILYGVRGFDPNGNHGNRWSARLLYTMRDATPGERKILHFLRHTVRPRRRTDHAFRFLIVNNWLFRNAVLW
jgi:hypothetical protein